MLFFWSYSEGLPGDADPKTKPSVAVYVQKWHSTRSQSSDVQGADKDAKCAQVEMRGDTYPSDLRGHVASSPTTSSQNIYPLPDSLKQSSASIMETKGKELIVYNPFDVLMPDDESSDDIRVLSSVHPSSGPNSNSPDRGPL
ncbi:UNVERIFIED_CONTAM: hypothetical protein Sradi_7130400 [Sesamum radiatum]|uniref:Uncharacterized protein n=1 Tax=Sesamum radiatum TaxID=300843 RepID=A0AAW2IY50_SESRA